MMGGYPRIAGRADGDPRPLSGLHCRVLQVEGSGPQVMHEPIEALLGTGEKIAGEALIVEPLLSTTGKLSLGGGDSGLSTGPKRTSTRKFLISSSLVGLIRLNCELVSCIFGYMREFAYRAVPSAADRPNFGHGRPPKSEGRRTHP